MDGTLLRDDKTYDRVLFKKLLQRMNQKDIRFAVASGNAYHKLLEYFEDVKEDVIFLSENGTYIVNHDQELYVGDFKKADYQKAVSYLREIEDLHISIDTPLCAYIEEEDGEFHHLVKKYNVNFEVVSDLMEITDPPIKFACSYPKSNEEILLKIDQIQKDLPQFSVTYSGDSWIDLYKKGEGKGTGLKILQEKFGISKEETICFCDNLNDQSMIEQVQTSYAVSNAHPMIRKMVDVVIGENNEDSVVREIERIIR